MTTRVQYYAVDKNGRTLLSGSEGKSAEEAIELLKERDAKYNLPNWKATRLDRVVTDTIWRKDD